MLRKILEKYSLGNNLLTMLIKSQKIFIYSLIICTVVSLASFLAIGSVSKIAKAQTCQNSLQAAVSAIGSRQETLEITPGTWSVTASMTIPANIFLKVYKGGIINISSGVTLTIKGGLEAGDYRIFSGSGVVDMPAGNINVVWFTSGGNGTVSNPWVGSSGRGGIGEAIEHVKNYPTGSVATHRAFVLPAGEYLVTETIKTHAMGLHILGRSPSLSSQEGSRTHIHFSPSSPKILFEIRMMDNIPSGIVDCYNSPIPTESWHTGINGVYLTSNNPGGSGNVAISAVDISMSTFRDISIDNWSGTGIEARGREITTFDRIRSRATNPMIITTNPYCTSIDLDAHIFRDFELIGTANSVGSAVVKVVPTCEPSTAFKGIDITHVYFLGMQVWQGNQHGFSWVDSCNYGTDLDLTLANVQSKNAAPSGGYFSYMNRAGSSQHFYDYYIENSDGSDRSGGFSYANLIRNSYYTANSYNNSGYFMNTVSNLDIGIRAASISDAAKLSFANVKEAWSVKGGTRERMPKAIYLATPK